MCVHERLHMHQHAPTPTQRPPYAPNLTRNQHAVEVALHYCRMILVEICLENATLQLWQLIMASFHWMQWAEVCRCVQRITGEPLCSLTVLEHDAAECQR